MAMNEIEVKYLVLPEKVEVFFPEMAIIMLFTHFNVN
jgi:hypothetical protein